MMLRVNNEYLDFTDMVEVEKQVKLFEDISTTDGDFSYAFQLPRTINNMRILGNPMPDNIGKPVYQRINADLLNDSGAELFRGYIRVQRLSEVIECSFFSGNNNWFSMLSGKLSDLEWSEFDLELNEINFAAAIFNTEGIVLPLLDNGTLDSRGIAHLKLEDFVAGIYVKTVFAKIFNAHGIVIQGELLDDANFQAAITVKNGKSKEDVDSLATFAGKDTTTARPLENTDYKITFDTDSEFPYFDGSRDAFDIVNSTYTARFKMTINIEVILKPEIVDASYNNRIYLYINGVFTFVDINLASGTGGLYNSATAGSEELFTLNRTITLEKGDVLEIYSEWQQSGGSTPNDVLSGSVRITPIYIYNIFGKATVPDWTQQQYVSEILRVFNVIPSYKYGVLTLNLFEKIAHKPSIDLSEYITATESEYAEFIDSYGKRSYLFHVELEASDEFKALNMETRPYDRGVIEIANDFIENEADIVESSFTAPVTYVSPIFGMSMEKTDLLSTDEDVSVEFTSVVSGTAGRARFSVPPGMFVSDMVRIRESTNPAYNGDWMVSSTGTGWIELYGTQFDTDATGTAIKLRFGYSEASSVFLLHHIPLYPVPSFSSNATIRVEGTDYGTLSVAFYSLIDQNLPINREFPFSMSFAEGDQTSLIDQYYALARRIFNDPVKLYCEAYLPLAVYSGIDLLSPVMIKTLETQNRYYINRITGYKESYLPATIELIKL